MIINAAKRPAACFVFICIWFGISHLGYGADSRELFNNKAVISATIRFYVTGPNRAENVEVAAWAEEVSGRLADLEGWVMSRQKGERMINIDLVMDTARPREIKRKQYCSESGFVQGLRLQNVQRADQLEATEALCRLLLLRAAASLRGFSELPASMDFPAWYVHGIACHFSRPQRVANRSTVIQAWRQGRSLNVSAVLSGALPASLLSAAQGEFFEWMNAMPESRSRLRKMVEWVNAERDITPRLILTEALGYESVREAQQQWDLHLASLQQVVFEFGACTEEDVARLRGYLAVRPEVLSVATGEEVMETYRLVDLIAYRRLVWMPAFVERATIGIQEVLMGRAEKLVQVGALYTRFLKELLLDDRGVFAQGMSDEGLKALLLEADDALRSLESEVQTGQVTDPSITYLNADREKR